MRGGFFFFLTDGYVRRTDIWTGIFLFYFFCLDDFSSPDNTLRFARQPTTPTGQRRGRHPKRRFGHLLQMQHSSGAGVLELNETNIVLNLNCQLSVCTVASRPSALPSA